MSAFNRCRPRWSSALIFFFAGTMPALAGPVFNDTFDVAATYNVGALVGNYTASDENNTVMGAWTAAAGSLTYSRADSHQDPNYHYASSVLLTNGITAATGSTAGLTNFTVAGVVKNVPSVNTAQPGLIVSAALGSGPGTGGYLLAIDSGLNQGPGGPFALLAITGDALLGDEGSGVVVKNFGVPTSGDTYSISVTVDRSGANPDLTGTLGFTVDIFDLTSSSSFYSGSFSFVQSSPNFSGTQIGYRVRDPLDAETPSFGPLSLSVPEPASLALLAVPCLLISRRQSHRRS